MEDKIICSNQKELTRIAKRLLQKYPEHRIFALDGVMGSGKTTFMKYLCQYLKSNDTVSSPTFSIVNEYAFPKDDILYHFDFYRIKNIQEAIDMGFTEYLYSGKYCFIEWAEKVENLLPPETIHVKILIEDAIPDEERIFIF